jgi:UDPglucose 6-dehydrogenase
MARVAVIGLGYVGITTAVALAKLGHSVVGHDVSDKLLSDIASGQNLILEPGLEEALCQSKESLKLEFQGSLSVAVANADFTFVCVPTPAGLQGEIVLDYVLEVARDLISGLEPNSVLVIKSTLPAGGLERISEAMGDRDFGLCYNPEFLRQGSALNDFMNPDRVVIGSDSELTNEKVAGLYSELAGEVVLTDASSAELIKLAANSYLAMRLSFANEVAFMCEKLGASFRDVSKGIGLDPRIRSGYFAPGPGWGGSCLPKDTSGLSFSSKEIGASSLLLEATIESNGIAKKRVVERLCQSLGGDLAGRQIGVWGISFKGGTGDLRGSPAIDIIRQLGSLGASVRAYDPYAKIDPSENLTFEDSAISAIDGADALVILSEWTEFKSIEPTLVHQIMRSSIIYDARGVLDASSWEGEVDMLMVVGEPTKEGVAR